MRWLKTAGAKTRAAALAPLRWLQASLGPAWEGVARHAQTWRSAWREQKHSETKPWSKSQELEFLPAVLEIQETPPSPAGRAVGATVIAAFTGGILWATLGHVDIVTVAQGKIVPSHHTKIIQPLESGIVKAIHVREGQPVKKGDVLIELDTTIASADHARVAHEHITSRVEASRLRALLQGKTELPPLEGAPTPVIALQQDILQNQLNEQQARIASAKLIVKQRRAALNAAEADIARLEAIVPILEERLAAFGQLKDRQYVSTLQYMAVKEQHINTVQELAAARQKKIQHRAALAEARKNTDTIEAEFKKRIQAELAALDTRAGSLSKEVVKAGQRARQQNLTAPVAGVVQQLAIHTVGGVVTPAQQLLVIVPQEDQLEVEAWVQNKDIGFVNPNQVAEIKIEAFPFTRYGTIEGRVVTLSSDAVALENVGYTYAARVSMARSTVEVENHKTVKLTPGMTVAVEIKTGKRRVIEYFLSPLLRAAKESIRER